MQPKQHANRRNHLLKTIGNENIAIIWSGEKKSRNEDVYFPFRQDSDFDYLTGFSESSAVLVLAPNCEKGESLLFCQPRNPIIECWDGEIIGPERVKSEYLIDNAFDIAMLPEMLPDLMANRQGIVVDFDGSSKRYKLIMDSISKVGSKARLGVESPTNIQFLRPLLSEMRLIKNAEEIESMQHAADITVAAHKVAMLAAQTMQWEYQVQAVLEGKMRSMGASNTAFLSIVASGNNACVLHYVDNNAQLDPTKLMLIDAGAEIQGYASDVTTAFPLNGEFTGEQRAIYEVVHDAHKKALSALNLEGSWQDIHELTCSNLTQGLIDLGVLQGSRDRLLEEEAYKPWFMHRTGHWIGRDVHDVGTYRKQGEWRKFKPGMALTIEPGLYFPKSKDIHERWWGIGVRIEDSVVITEEGHLNLTEDIPRSIEDIEMFLKQ